jgi:flagellar motor switch protein FliM
MEKILSQNEIDALLRGVEEGKVETAPEQRELGDVLTYDFANPSLGFRGRIPAFEVFNDQFWRTFRNTLSSMLRKLIDVRPKGVQISKFGEFIESLPVPSSLHIFKMEPLRGHALLALESKLIFTLLDIFFGGPGKTTYKIEGREFTAIESRFIHKLVTVILSDFEKAWQVVYPFKIQHVRSEVNPEFVNVVPPSDPIVTVSFDVEYEQFAGAMTFCIPYSLIKPIKSVLNARFQAETLGIDERWVERFLDRIKETEVNVSVELGRKQVTIRELVHLKVGDTLMMNKETSEPLVGNIEGVPKFTARPGVYGSNRAVQFDGKITAS